MAWGYARAASALGVDIIQKCPVTSVTKNQKDITGVVTEKGTIKTKSFVLLLLGIRGIWLGCAVSDYLLSLLRQALVSEPIKPVMGVVMANTVHGYMSQSDKGEMVIGGGADGYNNFTQQGSFSILKKQWQRWLKHFL